MRTVSITDLPNDEKIYKLKRLYNDKGKCIGIKKEYVGTLVEIVAKNETNTQ